MDSVIYLHLVTDVDYESVGDGVEWDPGTVAEDLEARDLVLEEESDEVWVSVTRQAIGELWLWTWRVVIEGHVLAVAPN